MMPRGVTVILVVGLLFLLHPAAASCQPQWEVTAYAGGSTWVDTGFLDLDDASETAPPVFGVAIQRSLTGPFALEGDLQFLPRLLKRSGPDSLLTRSRLMVASASLAGRMRSGSRLMPRAAIGVAAVQFSARDRLATLNHDATLLGVTVSGGAILRMTRTLAARFDVRYLRTQRDVTAGLFDEAYVDLALATAGINIAW